MSRLGLKRNGPAPANGVAKHDAPAQALAHKFTDRQASFITHYVMIKNATQAALRAGYAESSARQQGAYLMANTVIRSEIERLLNSEAEQFEVSRGRWLKEVSKIAFSDMGNYLGEDGLPLTDFSSLSRDETAAIKSITVEEFKDGRSDKREVRRFKFVLGDKEKCLELVGKRYGWLVDKQEHDHRHSHTLMGTLLLEIDAESRKVIEHEEPNDAG